VVDLILATDMANHFEFLGQFRVTQQSENFDPEGAKHRELVTKCCLKSADLGHTALPWEMHEPWVLRLLTEFYEQGDEESEMGFPVSPFCARTSDLNVFKEGQKGFLHFVVLPLYKEITGVIEGCDVQGTCITRIEQNGKQWVEGELSPELVAVVTGTPQGTVISPKDEGRRMSSSVPMRWLPPSAKKQEGAQVFRKGDRVWIMKEGRMKGKLAEVLDPCWNGLVKVETEKDEKGNIKSYHPVEVQLAVQVPANQMESAAESSDSGTFEV